MQPCLRFPMFLNKSVKTSDALIVCSAFARVGLLGNPSDEYYGMCVACTIRNFSATVTLVPASSIRVERNPDFDSVDFPSLTELHNRVERSGFYAGERILWATCNAFYKECLIRQLPLESKGFHLRYTTTIPRQVGLGGSTAIEAAALKALMTYYGVTEDHFPPECIASVLTRVEQRELCFSAGMLDEATQALNGLLFLDFRKRLSGSDDQWDYVRLDANLLPPSYIAYESCGTEESRIHNDVRRRWLAGDSRVATAMNEIASCAERGREAIAAKDYETLSYLIDRNFDLRREVYGDAVLAGTVAMVELARELGLCAKSCGSGGAITGICEDRQRISIVTEAFRERGYQCVPLEVA
jgi:galactokinase/mevalonate kinase-like predicted kinase